LAFTALFITSACTATRTALTPTPGESPTPSMAAESPISTNALTATPRAVTPTTNATATQAAPTNPGSPTVTLSPSVTPEAPIHFAVIGDYGQAGIGEKEVSDLVHSWNPDFIITVGDNNYPDGVAATIDQNIGQYYHDFIFHYTGEYGPGSKINRFFPSLGNADWTATTPNLTWITLSYLEMSASTISLGAPVEFFAIDSDYHDPSGIDATSPQATWLKGALAASPAPWKIVYFHLPPTHLEVCMGRRPNSNGLLNSGEPVRS